MDRLHPDSTNTYNGTSQQANPLLMEVRYIVRWPAF